MERTAPRMHESIAGRCSNNRSAAHLAPRVGEARPNCRPRQCTLISQFLSVRPLTTFDIRRNSRQQRSASVVVTSVAGGASAVSGLNGARSDVFNEKKKPVSKWNLRHHWRTWWDLQVCPNSALSVQISSLCVSTSLCPASSLLHDGTLSAVLILI